MMVEENPNYEEPKEEELNVEDIAEDADDKVEALINLLVKKGVITEEEFQKEFEGLYEEGANAENTESLG